VGEALAHPWVSGSSGGGADEGQTIVEMMRAFNAQRKMKRGMTAVWVALCWRNIARAAKEKREAEEGAPAAPQ
jgi:hypothetical protein